MSLNIFEIWDKIGRQTPFAVRRDRWVEDQYAVVERIEIEKWPYGKAFGYPIVKGERSDRFNYSAEWVNDKVIPSGGTYQWSLAADVDINKGKSIPGGKNKPVNVPHSLESVLKFGKYKGERVEAVFRKEPGYLLWALIHVDKFCLMHETMDALETINADFKFVSDVRKLNEQKLKV